MTIIANKKIIISTSNFALTNEIFKVVKETVIKRFGEKSIVFSDVELESYNNLWYARIYLNLDKPIEGFYDSKPVIVLKEAKENDKQA